ncbi:MAG: hypothetical protein NC311_13360 [Muribaculaceae bacterium]|nr:hypothetical protein [Muribaculaceae bacterium]
MQDTKTSQEPGAPVLKYDSLRSRFGACAYDIPGVGAFTMKYSGDYARDFENRELDSSLLTVSLQPEHWIHSNVTALYFRAMAVPNDSHKPFADWELSDFIAGIRELADAMPGMNDLIDRHFPPDRRKGGRADA